MLLLKSVLSRRITEPRDRIRTHQISFQGHRFTDRKPACYFLLVNNSNLVMSHLVPIPSYCGMLVKLLLLTWDASLTPPSGVNSWALDRKIWSQKTRNITLLQGWANCTYSLLFFVKSRYFTYVWYRPTTARDIAVVVELDISDLLLNM